MGRKKVTPTHTKTGKVKITHRKGDGTFKSPPSKPTIGKTPLQPADSENDAGGGYRPGGQDPQP
jgi:hypothetical protein